MNLKEFQKKEDRKFEKLIEGCYGDGRLVEKDEFFFKVDGIKSYNKSRDARLIQEILKSLSKLTKLKNK